MRNGLDGCSYLSLISMFFLQVLATHIGEVVINKCFCTRRNPISISAAAIYLACQLEDKRKTQAEICKVTGLTEVTLRKVYKELLENWDDLLPSNYTPAVPPEKAFPTTAITSNRSSSSAPKPETIDLTSSERDTKLPETNLNKPTEGLELSRSRGDLESKSGLSGTNTALNQPHSQGFRQPWLSFGPTGAIHPSGMETDAKEIHLKGKELDKEDMDLKGAASPLKSGHILGLSTNTVPWLSRATAPSGSDLKSPFVQQAKSVAGHSEVKRGENPNESRNVN